jgi:hypothetical protein
VSRVGAHASETAQKPIILRAAAGAAAARAAARGGVIGAHGAGARSEPRATEEYLFALAKSQKKTCARRRSSSEGTSGEDKKKYKASVKSCGGASDWQVEKV